MTQPRNLSTIVTEAFAALVNSGAGRVSPEAALDHIFANYAGDLEFHKDALLREQLRKRCRDFTRGFFERELEEKPEQLALLPAPAPRYITVLDEHEEGGYAWVEYLSATLSDLEQNYEIKRKKRAELEERMRCDRLNIDALRTVMSRHPTMTVREALERMS